MEIKIKGVRHQVKTPSSPDVWTFWMGSPRQATCNPKMEVLLIQNDLKTFLNL